MKRTYLACDVCEEEKGKGEVRRFHINRANVSRGYSYSQDFSFDVCVSCVPLFRKRLAELTPSLSHEKLFPEEKPGK